MPDTQFPCTLDIGDPCLIKLQGHDIKGHVRAVTFTAGKVRFAVRVSVTDEPGDVTSLHNIDSELLLTVAAGERPLTDIEQGVRAMRFIEQMRANVI